ncbi:hypothetical protein [Streptomyces sp. Rer75]|uniref:hypothetical protein n=1 Tax=Streptomyces sp. Rer75 TaxID=2750011 RepID=UPI0015CFA1E3|nr:hypothetical protein [Streptomyces sp. Rer75]QLH24285.1 hypothetical protein HYQ63_29655 [Streptomyces sp. Rer75]
MSQRSGRLAMAALVAGGLVLLSACGDSDDGGKDGGSSSQGAQAKTLGKVSMPKVTKDTNAMGMWVTGKNFVKGDIDKIVGYSPDGAKTDWTIELDGEICWASPHTTEDGAGLDLNKGKLVWQKEGTDTEGNDGVDFDEVTISGNTIAAGGTSGGGAWSLEGKPLWKPEYIADCDDDGYAGGDGKLVALRGCSSVGSSTETLEIQTVDPTTRKVLSSYKLDGEFERAHVLSTAPLVVAADTGDSDGGSSVTDILTIDDSAKQGKLVNSIDVLAKGFQPDCPAVNVEGCKDLALDKKSSTVYLSSEVDVDDGGPGEKITGVNFKTGKQTGRTKMAESRSLTPISTEKDGSLIAYQGSMYSEAGGVVRIDPKTFEVTQIQKNPDAMKDAESGMETYGDARMVFTDKKLYLGSDTATRPTSDSRGRPLAVVFGTA